MKEFHVNCIVQTACEPISISLSLCPSIRHFMLVWFVCAFFIYLCVCVFLYLTADSKSDKKRLVSSPSVSECGNVGSVMTFPRSVRCCRSSLASLMFWTTVKKKSLKPLKADPSSTIGKTDVHKQVIEIYPVQRKSLLISMSISMFYQISSTILYIDWQRLRKTLRQTDEAVKDQDIRQNVSKWRCCSPQVSLSRKWNPSCFIGFLKSRVNAHLE